MKYVDEYRNRQLVDGLRSQLHDITRQPLRIMEVCGTHTMSIFRHGIRQMLPDQITLVSGPGCPVCVTPSGVIDAFVDLATKTDVVIATFGDMLRVPGEHGSLASARANGAQVELVYSPMDALALAEKKTGKLVVFISVGFETTTPTIAATLLEAKRKNVTNFCVIPANKTMPPPLKALLEDPQLALDGLLCPGHVSIITGTSMYDFLAKEYGIACAVTGFEPTDILQGIVELVRQVESGRPEVANCYGRVVSKQGNPKAQKLVDMVFMPVDSEWRGLGIIPGSGLGLREEFHDFDAIKRLRITVAPSVEPKGCRCGEILKGICSPSDCPLFGKRCTPSAPVGPCMVSSEGTCATWHRYGGLL